MMAEGWVLLDVRPPGEVEKAGVKGKKTYSTDNCISLLVHNCWFMRF